MSNRPRTAIQNANLPDIKAHQSTVYQYQEERCLSQGIQTCSNNYPPIIYDNIQDARTLPVGEDLHQQSYDFVSYQEYQSTPVEKSQSNDNSEDSLPTILSRHPIRVHTL
jgi:hypothetical protein